MLPGNRRQKSLPRRFLLILGAILFVVVFGWGVMVIFDNTLFPNLPQYQKIAFGSLIIIYAILRFSRLLKKKEDEL